MHPNRKKASGYTLIEVLIAVLILSIGLLSLAFTQANSMRYTHSAYLRSQATLLSGDILDSIRTNRMNAESGAYDITIGTPASGTGTIALNDLNTWKSNLAARLPQGDGAITHDAANGEFTVTVQWKDRDDTTTDPPTQFQVTTIP